MAWTDEPSDAQIGALLHLIRWEVSNDETPGIVEYLRAKCTRKDVSTELGRLRDLTISRKLNRDSAFEGALWEQYNKSN